MWHIPILQWIFFVITLICCHSNNTINIPCYDDGVYNKYTFIVTGIDNIHIFFRLNIFSSVLSSLWLHDRRLWLLSILSKGEKCSQNYFSEYIFFCLIWKCEYCEYLEQVMCVYIVGTRTSFYLYLNSRSWLNTIQWKLM